MIFNSRDLFYKSPFGAVVSGQVISFRLTLPMQTMPPIIQIYKAKNTIPRLSAIFDRSAECDPTTQEYVYEAAITAPEEGLYFYHFVLEKTKTISNGGNGQGLEEGNKSFQLTVTSPSYDTPNDLKGCVFYQIFPDRFCNSGSEKIDVPSERIIHKGWDEAPVDQPDADGGFWCQDYFGGDLKGIESKLPYIAELGVEGIYLNPIFEAHANHRYNTANYMKVDPLLGDEKDFKSLCDEAHGLGIKIILDGVFNHTGSDSIYFNKEKRYPLNGAANNRQSPYKDWFNWIDYPHVYESWWGFDTLPNINENSPSYREFICGKDGVIAYWIGLGADGFRLDVADELPDDFIADIRRAVKTANPNGLLIGEVWEDASNKEAYGVQRQYFQGEELDSVMNYPWRKSIFEFVRYGQGHALEESLMSIMENYPRPSMDTALNLLSSHDESRAITQLGGESMAGKDREWQRVHNQLSPQQFSEGRERFLMAAIIQYSLIGCPCLYYGDEAGLYGYADPFNRGTYPWGNEDKSLIRFFQVLGNIRKNSAVLRKGDFKPEFFDDNICLFTRNYDGKTILVGVNRGETPVTIPYTIPSDAKVLMLTGMLTHPYVLEKHSGVMLEFDSVTQKPLTTTSLW